MELGYKFLRVPGGNRNGEAERIEECDLITLRPFMCPITNGDTDYCLKKCKGFKTCRVGQKAAALLDEQARLRAQEAARGPLGTSDGYLVAEQLGWASETKIEPKKRGGWTWPEEARVKAGAKRTEEARKKVTEALATGDPVGWMMERGLSNKQATTDLSRWRVKYPDLFEGVELPKRVGGWNRGKVSEKVEAEERRQYREAVLNHQPKPYVWLAKERGIQERSAMNTLNTWRKKYGPVEQDASEPGNPKEPEEPMQSNTDMISLDEFLSQYTFLSPDSAEEPPKVEKAQKPIVAESVAQDPAGTNQNAMLAEMMRQEAELLDRIAELQKQVWDIRAERRKVERMMSH